jgi:alkylhydroperoxidase/carboxymuconolactone decarboxylase family protein YurZ
MDEVERLLRLLALNDEESVASVLAPEGERELSTALSPKVDMLVQLGALVALGAGANSMRATVRGARQAGASEAEVAEVLIAVAPAVGLARVVSSAPRLATAMGYTLNMDE